MPCRLLFHKVQPIFVFEGTTPALKRATTAARRARREFHSAALKRAAEKLLVNQIKRHALLEAQRQREQQHSEKQAGADTATAAVEQDGDDRPAAVGRATKRRRVSPVAAAAEFTASEHQAARVADAAAAPAAGAFSSGQAAEAGPSTSRHREQQQHQLGALSAADLDEDLEELQLAAALHASAAAAADPRGKRPAAAAEGTLPDHVVNVLKHHEQQYMQRAPEGTSSSKQDQSSGNQQQRSLDPKDKFRLAQEEADAALAARLDRELNSRQQGQRQGSQAANATGKDAALAAALEAAAAAASSDEEDDQAVLQFQNTARNTNRSRAKQAVVDDSQPSQRSRRSQPTAAQEQQELLRAIALKRQQQQQRRASGAAAAQWEPDDSLDLGPGGDKFTKLLNLKGPEFVGGGGDGGSSDVDDDDDDDGDAAAGLLLPADISSLDPAVLSTLPQSVQLDILEKMRDAQQAGQGWVVQGVWLVFWHSHSA
eukprot:GHUV01034152.1.p1 GENE.GHUV01034152.1~~GHUV01034152.1.p1  ORF type:complete len:485 (+),score=241.69 GHUV01034152.1:879-2333(+)